MMLVNDVLLHGWPLAEALVAPGALQAAPTLLFCLSQWMIWVCDGQWHSAWPDAVERTCFRCCCNGKALRSSSV
eukprot:7092200-Pyramimonas_sp.AAC.1